jgi:hypothetical protein
MAIEFHCPYCTAAIRVPDAAAGKRGKCPKCATRLLVPAVAVPDPLDPLAQPAPATSLTVPVSRATPRAPKMQPETPEIVPSIRTTRVRSRKRRRRDRRKRRRSSGLWVVIPLALLALLVVVLLFVFYQPAEKLEGTLTGQRITAVNITPARLTPADVETSLEDFAKAVESLKAQPLVLTSELVRTEIRGGENAIEVSIAMTSNAEFVAVDVNDPLLRQFVFDNGLAFGKRRVQRLRQSATQLVSELSSDSDRILSNPSSFRNAIALNLLRSGLGFVVEGAAGKILCPCVYESGDQIWFAVPAGTTSFTVQGRTIDDIGKLFPGRYEVTVSGTAEVVEVATDQDDETTVDADESSDVLADSDDSEKMEAATKPDSPMEPNQ